MFLASNHFYLEHWKLSANQHQFKTNKQSKTTTKKQQQSQIIIVHDDFYPILLIAWNLKWLFSKRF